MSLSCERAGSGWQARTFVPTRARPPSEAKTSADLSFISRIRPSVSQTVTDPGNSLTHAFSLNGSVLSRPIRVIPYGGEFRSLVVRHRIFDFLKSARRANPA